MIAFDWENIFNDADKKEGKIMEDHKNKIEELEDKIEKLENDIADIKESWMFKMNQKWMRMLTLKTTIKTNLFSYHPRSSLGRG